MQRWNWILTADMRGKWITTEGFAEVAVEFGQIKARLLYSEDAPPYHEITGTIDEDGCVVMEVASQDADIPAFSLQGSLFVGEVIDGIETKSMILTDGTTILGLTYGPNTIA